MRARTLTLQYSALVVGAAAFAGAAACHGEAGGSASNPREPAPATPFSAPVARNGNAAPTKSKMGMNYTSQAVTWDGRLIIGAGFGPSGLTSDKVTWAEVQAFLPEAVTAPSKSSAAPDFSAALSSPLYISTSACTAPLPGSDAGEDGAGACGAFSSAGVLAMSPVPATSFPKGVTPPPLASMNPYSSDGAGNYVAGGPYQTYQIEFFLSSRANGASSSGTLDKPSNTLYVAPAQIVVADPNTTGASIISAVALAAPQPLQIGSCSSGCNLGGTFQTATVDGRFLVMNGAKGTSNNPENVFFSYNQAQNGVSGWTTPLPLDELNSYASTPVAKLPLATRYPLAAQPLYAADGSPYASPKNPVRGLYPWISFDGTEIAVEALQDSCNAAPSEAEDRLAGFSLLGRVTNWTLRMADGPANPDRCTTPRTIITSPGMTSSFWTPYRLAYRNPFSPQKLPCTTVGGCLPYLADPPLPYTTAMVGSTPTYEFFQSIEGQYDEIDMQDALDKDYVAVLHMNEAVNNGGTYDVDVTPDTSGNSNNATLHGATFEYEYSCLGQPACAASCSAQGSCVPVDAYTGATGSSVYFRGQDTVTASVGVTPPAALPSLSETVTAQLWVLAMPALCPGGASGQPTPVTLAELSGAWTMSLDGSGDLVVSLARTPANGGPVTSVGQPAATCANAFAKAPKWTNVAFSFDGYSGLLRVYVGGESVWQQQVGPGALSAPTGLVLGPQASATTAAVYQLDELFLSRVVRSPGEIARNAFQNVASPASMPVSGTGSFESLSGVTVPPGLLGVDFQVPQGAVVTPAAQALGQALFFDPNLSRDGSVSCSHCHAPSSPSDLYVDMTDALQTSQGYAGATLLRNTPANINRGYSTAQFFDGRASEVAAQAGFPIDNPSEMSFSVAELVAYLSASTGTGGYRSLFDAAFGAGTVPSRSNVEAAIAAYEYSILAGGSAVDSYFAGAGALTPQQLDGLALFEGKARCITCHSNSNLTDELFHDTNNTTSGDIGRYFVSGRSRDQYAFKTPSLRNLGQSFPYMHDGSIPGPPPYTSSSAAAGLSQLVARYGEGGLPAGTAGLPLANMDPNMRPLELTPSEKVALEAFIDALQSVPIVSPPAINIPRPAASAVPTTLRNTSFSSGLSSWDSGEVGGAAAIKSSACGSQTACLQLTPQVDPNGPTSITAESTPGFTQLFPAFVEQAVYFSAQSRAMAVVSNQGTTSATATLELIDDLGAVRTPVSGGYTQTLAPGSGWVSLELDVSSLTPALQAGQLLRVRLQTANGGLVVDSVTFK